MNIRTKIRTGVLIFVSIGTIIGFNYQAFAIGSQQNPQSGALGLEATIPSPPPTQAATIAVPTSGQSFSNMPISVSGLCPNNLLIKVFSNNIFIGSAVCTNSSYALKVDLFDGLNDLYAQDFDSLGQGGPLSGISKVSLTSPQASPATSQVTLTSSYAELGANPGQQLNWPIVISGGTPPYAISTDWGDGQTSTLQSSAFAGKLNLSHTYATAGVYTVTVTASDSTGATAFLQLVGVANGQIVASTKPKNNNLTPSSTTTSSNLLNPWSVLAIVLVALVPAFWLGSRHGRSVLLKKYN